MKKVIIVGAGPGGLSAGMILASRGYNVEIYEKQNFIGGRTSSFKLGDFTFDLGPTFLMMVDILRDTFKLADRKMEDYITIKNIDPLYSLVFNKDKIFYPSRNMGSMKEQIEKLFPGNYEGYLRFLQNEKVKYEKLVPCLQVPYGSIKDFFTKQFVASIPKLDAHISLFDKLGEYFNDDDLKIAFTFQAKYLGMSPWECPGTFSIISYIEHGEGIYHVMGGLNQIAEGMAKAIEEEGGKIFLNTPVKEILIENGRAIGVKLEDGKKALGDDIIINADFAYALNNLVDDKYKKKYTKKKLQKKKFSCSTFMIYLGLDKIYDLPHHNILFSKDYKKNVDETSKYGIVSDDPSIYVQNASIIDKSLAPRDKSTLYILVPVPNNRSGFNWHKYKNSFRDKILSLVEERAGLKDLREHIEVERVITPDEWEYDMNIYAGATFNLGHNISQMLYFRPHNKFEEFKNCFLVGGGTHPGSGLPTIFESAKISSNLILERDGLLHPIANI